MIDKISSEDEYAFCLNLLENLYATDYDYPDRLEFLAYISKLLDEYELIWKESNPYSWLVDYE